MDKTIIIRCFDTCVYTLVFPAFFLDRPLSTARKLFKWLFQFDHYRENQDSIEFLDRELPQLIEDKGLLILDAENFWKEQSRAYQNGYRDPNPLYFPGNWTKKQKRTESSARRKRNAELIRDVKDAKAAYERAKKVQEHAKKLHEIFLAEKR